MFDLVQTTKLLIIFPCTEVNAVIFKVKIFRVEQIIVCRSLLQEPPDIEWLLNLPPPTQYNFFVNILGKTFCH